MKPCEQGGFAQEQMRLQKYLAACGVASRRQAEAIINEGRVTVNGQTASIGLVVDPRRDAVAVDGKPVAAEQKVYVLLNKPSGCVTSARDTHGRKTVLDCLRGLEERVFPVGRLDMDVEGVLILTNDGELAYRLTHPRYEVKKVYVAKVPGSISPETLKQLESGVVVDGKKTAPARARVLKPGKRHSILQLELHEGRKREVKRMCAAVGHPVETLTRVSMGGVSAKGLEPGQWRRLAPEEIAQLRKRAGLL